MILPTLSETPTSRDMMDVFGGYNHNLKIGENEFYDMINLTSNYYPVLSPRGQRGVVASPTSPQGLISKDALCYVDGENFVIGENSIDMGLSKDASMCPKQLVSMGAYVVIMPDKKYINTKNLTDWGSFDASFTTSTTITYSMCKADGSAYDNTTVSATEPSNPVNNAVWIDTSTTPHTLKQYSSASAVWTPIATTYVKIASANIAKDFKQYDGVAISGIDSTITQLKDLNGQVSVLWDAHRDTSGEGAGDYLVVVGLLDEVKTQSSALTISRKSPKMDFVTECNNRLWGCRYGVNNAGEVVNEIYASKLGDFRNWFCYMGLSTDSYAASCGTDGEWTGAITHLGYPIFFKEGFLHKVYGNYPSNYQIQSTACRGVQKGSHRSLAIVNETLFYKSRNGICAYDGSLPSEVSACFGEEQYTNAVAGANANKYYISMKDVSNKYNLFVFDTAKGMWHKEDNTQADCFCSCDGQMYYIDHNSKKIMNINGGGTVETKPIEWMAETGVIGTSSPDKKYVSRLTMRLMLNIGANVKFFIQYNSMGEWEHIGTVTGTNLRSFSVPIRPKRCDHFRLRIVGVGEAKVYSISKTIEQGSEI